jgi:hypothetical protein
MEQVDRNTERLRRRTGNAPTASRRPDVHALYQVIIECCDEADQRDLFERLRREGRRVRLLVL